MKRVYLFLERDILLQFKDSITDDPYNSLASWTLDGDICNSFNGVACNPEGFVDKIVLWNTSLAGSLTPSLSGLKSIRVLTLFGNRFTGNLPLDYSKLQTLWTINVSSNALSGPTPEFIGGLTSLRFLDLSRNGFSGEIPTSLFRYCDKTKFVSLSRNNLSGPIPDTVANCNNLVGFDFSYNSLNGVLPPGVCDIPVLEYISVRNNLLSGDVSEEVVKCKRLSHVDLGSNMFQGSGPFEVLGFVNITYVNVSWNRFGGEIGEVVGCGQRLEFLDASSNELTGGISSGVTGCKSLKLLDLESNKLSGSIPGGIGKMEKLSFLDLSQNSLSGSIPSSLGSLNRLTHFNVSHNNLSGVIPPAPALQAFGASAFENNPLLCGDPLVTTPCNSRGAATGKSRNSEALSVSVIIVIVAAAVILFGVCVVLGLNLRARKRRKDEEEEVVTLETTPLASSIDSSGGGVIIGKLVLFSKNLPSKYEDWEAGTKALLDKDNIIGMGSIGSVYRASFEGGVSIAVKKLETLGRIRNQEEFEQELGRLGGLQHQNLSSYQGYYFSSTMQLILSDFVPNGSLYDNLHSRIYPGASTSHGNTDLNWHRRFGIALGTAKALSFLHDDCKPAVLHLNVKSTNILLDERYEAKLSDYGLEKFLPKFHNAVGYIAPELAQQSLKASEKCDVYSYGVVLLELVTGRKPVESPSRNQVLILRDYVRDMLETGSASDCFDRRLREFEENELIQVMKLGLLCTSENPLKRPSMAEVVQVLESIRNGFGS
ncbi:BnaC05g09380D [Brassica napus]|uniref:BnaC05g09380D protein n=1 Tax=Brassica napus TaxID=3708 RepID=A0A078GY01_BRANA|nr:BnaC05g09380D [Brassica napus]